MTDLRRLYEEGKKLHEAASTSSVGGVPFEFHDAPPATRDFFDWIEENFLYHEAHWEVFDPHTGNQVALFFNAEDAHAYLNWRNSASDDVTRITVTGPQADRLLDLLAALLDKP